MQVNHINIPVLVNLRIEHLHIFAAIKFGVHKAIHLVLQFSIVTYRWGLQNDEAYSRI